MTEMMRLSRRRFLQATTAAGGGLVLGFHVPLGGRGAEAAAAPVELNAWLRIAPDNTITVMVNHSEMGQGIFTGLPMLVAEELDVDWTQVRAKLAPAGDVYKDPVFGIQMTGGSSAIPHSWLQYRQIGKWRDYLYGEKVYITLSLVAKSLLAWQVFAGTLVPPK